MCLQGSGSRMPEWRWLVDALCILDPTHYIFDKDFYPSQRAEDPIVMAKFDHMIKCGLINHSFFNGLPPQLVIKRKSLKAWRG